MQILSIMYVEKSACAQAVLDSAGQVISRIMQIVGAQQSPAVNPAWPSSMYELLLLLFATKFIKLLNKSIRTNLNPKIDILL